MKATIKSLSNQFEQYVLSDVISVTYAVNHVTIIKLDIYGKTTQTDVYHNNDIVITIS